MERFEGYCTLSETPADFTGGRVDEENHVIRRVKILGRYSRNRNKKSGKKLKYSDRALEQFSKLHEGTTVVFDHTKSRSLSDEQKRGYAEAFGDLRNTKVVLGEGKEAGCWGDLHYNPHHPLAAKVVYDAKHAPHRLSLSHFGTGSGRATRDFHLVEDAKRVFNVALCSDGATVENLFESEEAYVDVKKLMQAKIDDAKLDGVPVVLVESVLNAETEEAGDKLLGALVQMAESKAEIDVDTKAKATADLALVERVDQLEAELAGERRKATRALLLQESTVPAAELAKPEILPLVEQVYAVEDDKQAAALIKGMESMFTVAEAAVVTRRASGPRSYTAGTKPKKPINSQAAFNKIFTGEE